MSPFDAHSIDHLSPSSCSLWVSSPGSFVLQYLLKKPRHVGAAAHRGTAVEAGVTRALTTGELDNEYAIDQYNMLTSMSGDSRRDFERTNIPGMVTNGILELGPYGVPSDVQRRVEMKFDKLAVPMIGILDFAWPEHGVIVDLKTTLQLPSSVRTSHARQVAFYVVATNDNWSPRVTYVTPKKSATYEVAEPRRHLAALQRIGLSIQRFVALSKDPMELASLVAPDFDSFYWSDPVTRQQGFEIWGY